jgi:hypothetical protein
MDEKQFQELIKYVKRIDEKLDILTNFTRISAPKQEPTQEEKKILELCNLKNTVADMVKKTNKKNSNVQFLLSSLRSKGLIKSEKRDDKVVYSRL